ncbi:MAG: hypothetical protein JO013_07470 [Alphaproteobacteria bacterium]|nr:hypothetical protein [Alphaproteobacteria bacterium]
MNKVIAAALSLVASAAIAAPPAREAPVWGTPSTPEDLQILHEFSVCVAERHPREAEALLASDFTTEEYNDQARRLAQETTKCIPVGRLRFNQVLFAGGMAEALLRRGHGPLDLAARTAYDPKRPPIQARGETEMMALCAVRAAPAAVEALLATPVASARETEVEAALGPAIGGCLKAGMTLRLNRPMLRAVLALAAHRLAADHGAGR